VALERVLAHAAARAARQQRRRAIVGKAKHRTAVRVQELHQTTTVQAPHADARVFAAGERERERSGDVVRRIDVLRVHERQQWRGDSRRCNPHSALCGRMQRPQHTVDRDAVVHDAERRRL
jgi:hypothetical protein